MKRIFRRREPGQPPRRGVVSLFRGRRARGQRLPGYSRMPAFRLPGMLTRWPPWRAPPDPPAPDPTQETEQVLAPAPPPSFKDRGQLRRRLRFLRRARELGFRDIGGLIFDMRRFERSRPDLLDAKLDALLHVDQELRALERILDDRRPFHELREPGISSCARCGALHASDANFCPHCGMQFSGPRAMGEVGGAIAAPPQAPLAPDAGRTIAPSRQQQEWPWPAHEPEADQPTAPTVSEPDPVTEQLTVAYVPVLQSDPPEGEPAAEPAAGEPAAAEPVADEQVEPPAPAAQSEGDGASAAQPDGDGTPAPQPAAGVTIAGKPSRRKRAGRKLAAKRAAAAKPPARVGDPDEPSTDDLAADEEQTETHLPPQASSGS